MNKQETHEATKEIVPAPVRPLVSPKQASEDWALFQELKQRLLTKSDFATIKGTRYVCKSGLRKLAVYFGLSDRISEQNRHDRDDGSFTWRIIVEAKAPNGRVSTGVGVCDSRERDFAHVEHDVYATAHTRAKNRAFSDMFAGGIVSAEEMEAEVSQSNEKSSGLVVSTQEKATNEKIPKQRVFGHWPGMEE